MTTGTGVGHPTPALPWVDVATGSPGQGLPYGVGIALAGAPRRGSGTPDELMEAAGISASRIATAARELVKD